MSKISKTDFVGRLRQIQRRNIYEKRCADCTDAGPPYVCMDFLTFVCTNCSGIHREFNHKVKGISMSKWTEEEISKIEKEGGNEKARKKYMARWTPEQFEEPSSGMLDKVKDIIRMKYVDKHWYSDSGPSTVASAPVTTNDTKRKSVANGVSVKKEAHRTQRSSRIIEREPSVSSEEEIEEVAPPRRHSRKPKASKRSSTPKVAPESASYTSKSHFDGNVDFFDNYSMNNLAFNTDQQHYNNMPQLSAPQSLMGNSAMAPSFNNLTATGMMIPQQMHMQSYNAMGNPMLQMQQGFASVPHQALFAGGMNNLLGSMNAYPTQEMMSNVTPNGVNYPFVSNAQYGMLPSVTQATQPVMNAHYSGVSRHNTVGSFATHGTPNMQQQPPIARSGGGNPFANQQIWTSPHPGLKSTNMQNDYFRLNKAVQPYGQVGRNPFMS